MTKAIQSIALIGFMATVVLSIQLWLDYRQLAVMGTVLIHLPMAALGAKMAWETAAKYPKFATLCAAFVTFNAVLI